MPNQPLDFLEVTEMRDGQDPVLHKIPISKITNTGIVIGRYLAEQNGKKPNLADLEIGSEINNDQILNAIGKRHVTLYKMDNPDRGTPDLYLRRGYRDQTGKWISPKPNTGFDVSIGGVPIDRYAPVQLRTGTLIQLIPRLGGYQCILQWALKLNGDSQPPTIPVDENKIGRLQFENRTLKEQNAVRDITISQLKELTSKIKEYGDKAKIENEKLRASIDKERKVNHSQDSRIKNQEQRILKIRILGIFIVVAMAIALGLDIEELDKIIEMAVLIAGGGMFMVASNKGGV